MSADDGIYILKTVRHRRKVGAAWVQSEPHFVYRVAYASAIDNFNWLKENKLYNLGAYMLEVWGLSPVLMHEATALLQASNLSKDHEYLEYGICHIDASEFVFYGDM